MGLQSYFPISNKLVIVPYREGKSKHSMLCEFWNMWFQNDENFFLLSRTLPHSQPCSLSLTVNHCRQTVIKKNIWVSLMITFHFSEQQKIKILIKKLINMYVKYASIHFWKKFMHPLLSVWNAATTNRITFYSDIVNIFAQKLNIFVQIFYFKYPE